MYRFAHSEPSAVRHRAMIELTYSLRARLLTQLGSLEFRDIFKVPFFRWLPKVAFQRDPIAIPPLTCPLP
jgi:hypothetical protein